LATTAIEGNTLTEEQVLRHLEGKLQLPPSQDYLKQEVDNIIAGCSQISDSIQQGQRLPISVERINQLNEQVLKELTLDDHVIPGRIRTFSVGVARYRGAPHEDCEHLLKRLCEWLNGPLFQPSKEGHRILYATIQAILAHLYLAWIHPYGDGNGRTARLLEFQILISSGVPAPAAHLLSNHYNKTRTEYYRQLDRTSKTGGKVIPFIEYAVQGFLDGLKEQLDSIREQQWDVIWRNYVHESFREQKGVSDKRRRDLVLDLSRHDGWVPRNKLTEISPRIAKAYFNKTSKTLSRDLNTLWEMGLIRGNRMRGYQANKSVILAFLPTVATK
jgi:Fic family protein